MRKINLIFQEILKVLLLFMFAFVWFRYYTNSLSTAIVFSILTAICIYFLLAFFKRKKQKVQELKIKEKSHAQDIFLSISFAEKPIDFFAEIIARANKVTKKTKHFITYQTQDGKDCLFYLDTDHFGIDVSRFAKILQAIKKEKAQKIIISCKEIIDKQVKPFSQNFPEKYIVLDCFETYQKIYKHYGQYPQITHSYKTASKLVFKDLIAHSFNKQRTRGYIFSAFVLMFSSLFVRTTIYYCVIASLLVIFAIISQFNPYFNNKNENNII